MKKSFIHLVLIAFVVLLISSCSSISMLKEVVPSEMRTFEKIIEFSNQSKDDLYVKANSWLVETFNSAESVIEYQDKEAGKIMGKYVFSFNEEIYYYYVKQTISLETKEGKVRIIINDPFYKIYGDMLNGIYPEHRKYQILEFQKGIEYARIEWNKLAESLTNYLNKNTDW